MLMMTMPVGPACAVPSGEYHRPSRAQLERLNRADLVVGEHDRDEDRLVSDRALDVRRVDATVATDRQVRHAEAVLLEALARVENRLVLRDGGDDVVALVLVELGDALEREVVRLRRAGGEDDLLLARGADQLRDALARVVDRLLRGPSEDVATARRVRSGL